MLRKFFIYILLILAIFAVFGGLNPVFAEDKEVKVGVIYHLSGPMATAGKMGQLGMEIAAEIINNRYEGLNVPMAETEGFPNFDGAKIKLIFLDDQGNPERAMSAVDQLITQEKVVAVMGSIASSVTATGSQAAERLGVPFLCPGSSSPILTERGFKWFFRCAPDDDLYTKGFFEFMKETEKEKGIDFGGTIAMMCENTLWGTDVATAIRKYASQYGYEIVADIPYTAKSASLTSEILKLKATNADIVILASYVSDAILIQNTMKDMNYMPPILFAQDSGHNDPNFITTLGDMANYIISREVYTSNLLTNPTVFKINEMLLERNEGKYPMVQSVAQGVMGLLFLADAISRAESLEPEDIRAAIMETYIPPEKVIFPWPEGMKLNEKGQLSTGRGIMIQILDQKYETIWPFNIASEEMVLPIPSWDER